VLKKTIEYENLDGDKVTEDFYFHLSPAEIAEMELSEPGGLSKRLSGIVESGNPKLIIETFKDILRTSYGRRSEDGKRFVKDAQFWREFTETDAYSQLFIELVTNANSAAEFVNGIIPASVREKVAKMAQTQTPLPIEIEDKRPAWIREDRDPTKAELMAMSPDEMKAAFRARLERA